VTLGVKRVVVDIRDMGEMPWGQREVKGVHVERVLVVGFVFVGGISVLLG
jgi:hypothetical protein